jgi:hypothetical protein
VTSTKLSDQSKNGTSDLSLHGAVGELISGTLAIPFEIPLTFDIANYGKWMSMAHL